jgi:formylmethanofuran dehydrogenase subunit E
MELPRDLVDRAVEFHGHLGPYLMLGLRVGWLARRDLRAGPFELRAEVGCPPSPPGSCFLDGIQVGSGCTVGKANLCNKSDGAIWARFEAPDGGLRVRIVPAAIERVTGALAGSEDVALLCEEIASGRLDAALLDLSTS